MKKLIMALAMAITVALSANTASADNVKARLVIDIGPMGFHSWILKGIKDGAFAKRGVDLEFVGKGPGSVKTTLALSAGKAELGYHDYSGIVLVNSKSQDPKVTAIFVVDDKAQDGVYSKVGSGIKTVDDLQGKQLGGFITGTTARILPSVTSAKWNTVNMTFSARVPALVSDKVDAIEGFLTTNKFNLEKAGYPWDKINVIKLSDKFPMAVSRVISVNTDWAKANPEAVIAIREVCKQLLAEFVKNPAASVTALSGPIVSTAKKRDIELRRAQFGIDELVMTTNVKVNGFNNAQVLGPRLTQYTDLLVNKLGLPNRHANSKYFDLD